MLAWITEGAGERARRLKPLGARVFLGIVLPLDGEAAPGARVFLGIVLPLDGEAAPGAYVRSAYMRGAYMRGAYMRGAY